MYKWTHMLPLIRKHAGNKPTKEIAKLIGTSVGNLHKICHRSNISLPRDPLTYRQCGPKALIKNLEAAKKLLTNAGYQVLEPE